MVSSHGFDLEGGATVTASSAVSPSLMREWLSLAQRAAREAAAALRQGGLREARATRHLERDVKISADRTAEKRILQCLRRDSDFPVLSEECGAVPGAANGQPLQWIVDPLDGSVNYWRGLPWYGISVALWRGQEPLVGVVYDFLREELFAGIVGGGAWLNDVPIQVSETDHPSRAILCTGFPTGTAFTQTALTTFVTQVQSYKKVRIFGSAALSLCAVAAGRADAYLERDIKLWDVAAGLAIVLSAGGRIARRASTVPHALTVYAGNASLSPCL